jgi:hypothetical protein
MFELSGKHLRLSIQHDARVLRLLSLSSQTRLAIQVGLVSAAGFALLAGSAAAQPSIQIAGNPQEYVPFPIVVTFSKAYCLNDTAALSEIQYTGNTLSISLSHLFQRSPCSTNQTVTVPGLPRGATTVKVLVTERGPLLSGFDQQGVTNIAETVSIGVVVQPSSSSLASATFWTGRFTPPTGGPTQFVLTPSRFSAFNGAWDWLEAGDPATQAYTFKAFSFAAADTLPDALSRLYSVPYPDPLTGVYWTADLMSAEALARSWSKSVTSTQYAVGRLKNGSCSIGMSPVYQSFNSNVIAHRWTQSRSAYSTMLANGFSGDGVVWCAPALRGE